MENFITTVQKIKREYQLKIIVWKYPVKTYTSFFLKKVNQNKLQQAISLFLFFFSHSSN